MLKIIPFSDIDQIIFIRLSTSETGEHKRIAIVSLMDENKLYFIQDFNDSVMFLTTIAADSIELPLEVVESLRRIIEREIPDAEMITAGQLKKRVNEGHTLQ